MTIKYCRDHCRVCNGHFTGLLLNLALENELDGFLVEAGATNTGLARNRARESGDDGIQVDSASTTLTRNRANRNVDFGILAVFGVTDGGGNLANGNGNAIQCQNVLCFSFATVQSTSQRAIRVPVTAASEDRWASASGSVAVRGASKAYKLRGVKNRFVHSGSSATLKLRVPAKARKAIKRALRKHNRKGRAVTARIKLSVHNRAGNTRTIRRTVRLKR